MTIQHNQVRVIIGPPGTGKTTRLIGLLERELNSGVEPNRVAFISFTRRAVYEAASRVRDDLELSTDDTEYFRTLHSFCSRHAVPSGQEVLRRQDLRRFGELYGYPFARGRQQQQTGNVLHHLMEQCRIRLLSPEEILEWHPTHNVTAEDLEAFIRRYREFKTQGDRVLIDYTEMIERFIRQNVSRRFGAVFIDEAQDLSPLQWRAVQVIADHAERMYIAGDDDQAIYQWAGSDTKSFMELPGEREVLSQSYRLPRRVYHYSQHIIRQVEDRLEKDFRPREEHGLTYLGVCWQSVVHAMPREDSGSWLILSRTQFNHQEVCEYMTRHGVLWASLERDYRTGSNNRQLELVRAGRAVRRLCDGESIPLSEALNLSKYSCSNDLKARIGRLSHQEEMSARDLGIEVSEPRLLMNQLIKGLEQSSAVASYVHTFAMSDVDLEKCRVFISTIHNAKGAEADNVLLFTKLTPAMQYNMQHHRDTELRNFYVGLTRARSRLFLSTAPRGDNYPWMPKDQELYRYLCLDE